MTATLIPAEDVTFKALQEQTAEQGRRIVMALELHVPGRGRAGHKCAECSMPHPCQTRTILATPKAVDVVTASA